MSSLIDRDRRALWHPYTQMKTAPAPLPVARGEGVWLYTEDGRKLLDGISSWWVNIHGHAHPHLVDAMTRQARQLEQVLFAGCTHRPAVELAERLVEILPAGLTRIFYSDNGSTAVEVALKMALQYWKNRGVEGRTRFVALTHAYHGDTVGAMSVSAESPFTRPFAELMFTVLRAEAPHCHRCPLGLERSRSAIDCVSSLERCLREHGSEIAAVIIEPMLQGAGGMIVWPAEYLAEVRRLCSEHGVLLIADEVLTGFGRTGRMFACEHAGVRPDLLCVSKALTGGMLPLAATAVTEEIYDAFLSDERSRAFFHGHSYTANPIACAVALASLDLFGNGATLSRVAALEQQFRRRLEPLRAHPYVGDVRVIGGVGAIELAGDGYLDDLGPRLAREFVARGLLLRPLGNVVYFMPPYAITESEAEWALDVVADVVAGIVRDRPPATSVT